MAPASPTVRDGMLYGGSETVLALDSDAWQEWLASAGSFRFHGAGGTFTARREQQRNGWYWYAYRRVAGRLRKTYLGRSQDLTLARLEVTAAELGATSQSAAVPHSAPRAEPPAGLLATKMHPPSLGSRLVVRPRLASKLVAVLHVPLTLVVAPAGSGKTTLVASWLLHFGLQIADFGLVEAAPNPKSQIVNPKSAWLSLDACDNDPARFWAYVAAALDPLVPGAVAAIAPLLQSQHTLSSLPTHLLNLMSAVPQPIVLALDDYHQIESETIRAGVALLVEHAPRSLHLVLLSRADPPLPLARLRARGQLHEIRAADLRFTPDEAEALLATIGIALTPETLALLEQRTEGWAAGLQLAALALRDRDGHGRFVASFAGSHRSVSDYLAEEVIERQPAPVQRFLLYTAVLERMCAELCDFGFWTDDVGFESDTAIQNPKSKIQNSQAMLDYLERANLFLVPLDDERRWYRYHHLFGEMLRDRLRRREPHLWPLLHRRAAEWYRDAGFVNEAVAHALAAEDYQLAADLIEPAVGSVLWILNEVHTLNRWLAAFPPEALRSRPRLLVAHAWALLAQVRLDDVEQVLRQLEADPALEAALHGHIAATRSFLFRLGGDIPAALAAAHHALEDLPEDDINIRSLVASNLENAYMALGDVRRAERTLAALDETHLPVYNFHRLNVTLSRAWMCKARGQLHEAHAHAARALRAMQEAGHAELPSTGLIHTILAYLFYEWNELDQAEHHARTAVALGDRWWNNDVLVNAYGALGWILMANGRPEAEQMFAESERLLLEYNAPFVRREMALGKAHAALLAGRRDEALRWEAECGLSPTDDPPPIAAAEYMVLARALICRGEAAQALLLLERLLAQAVAGEYVERIIELHKLHALAHAALGNTTAAQVALCESLALAQPGGYIRTFLDEGTPVLRLIREAFDQRATTSLDPLHAYVRTILAAAPVPQPASTAPNTQPEQLTRRELEVLRLLAAGWGNKQIAGQLHVEVSTVRSHVKNIYAKLAAAGRVQAVVRARERGLLAT